MRIATLALILLGQASFALTVSEQNDLSMRMSRAQAPGYEALREVFSGSPNFEFECVLESKSGFESDESSDQARVARQVPEFERGGISFYFDARKFGFNVSAIKDIDGRSTENSLGTTLECGGLAEHKCSSLTLEWISQVPLTPEDEKAELEPVVLTENLELLIVNPQELYARFSVSAQASQTNMLGGHTGSLTVARRYLCALTPSARRLERDLSPRS